MTLRSLLAESEAVLGRGPHPERARLDAETLLLRLLAQNRAWLLAHSEDPVDPEICRALRVLIVRRALGEPIQYITGSAEFFGLPFNVDPGVLVPRPETEHLVEEVLRLAAQFSAPSIADIGTGSGAIAVALAHALPNARLTAVDLSSRALKVARENAELNRVADRIEFLEGNLLAPLSGTAFDLIVSNPPYVPLADLASLSVEVRDHEPHAALFAGEDGLDIYRQLIPDAVPWLGPGGWLILEIGYGQQPAVEKLLLENGYSEVHFVPDYQDIPRVAAGRRPRE